MIDALLIVAGAAAVGIVIIVFMSLGAWALRIKEWKDDDFPPD